MALEMRAHTTSHNTPERRRLLKDGVYHAADESRAAPRILLDDPRVRRALHLAFDKAVLVDLIQETAPVVLGGFLYPLSEFATPPDKLAERLGYQRDPTAAIKEARQLMAAAGYSNGLKNVDFMVREVAIFKLWADAIQAMRKETLKIETNRRTVQVSVWFDEAQAGNFDLTISAIVSTLLDASDYFHS